MKKLLFTFAIALISAMPLTARQLSETEALARVQTGGGRHAAATLNQGASPRLIATRTAKSGNALYVFTTPGSTMFVSADDVAIPLLGYTDVPLENLDNIPPAMKWWIDQYVRQIDYVLSHPRATTTKAGLKTPGRKAPQKAGRKDIAPLLSTKWDQGAPYNNQCPALNGSTTYTGCVATAMAQAMYYHKWPAKGTGSKTYHWGNGNKNLTASLNVTFDWDNMLLTYPDASSGTAAQRTAVATLMKACGYAVEMDYGGDNEAGSGALTSNLTNALIDNFGYDAAAAYERRDYFLTSTWERMVYEDLANVGPVIYGGQGDMGGHCFVCDGYSAADNKFHINWGWSGDSDGYFALDALDPEDLGAGGGGGGFDYGQDAVFGLRRPVAGSTRQLAFMAAEGYLDATAAGRKVTMTCGGDMAETGWGFVNMSPVNGTFNIGVEILNNLTNSKTYVTIISGKTLVPYEGYETLSFNVPSSIGNGDYTITPVYQLKGSSSWTPMRYYVEGGVGSLSMNVNGNTIEISGGISTEVPDELYVMMSEPMPTFETGKTSTFRTTIINEHDKEMTVTLYAALCLEYEDKPGLIFPDDTARGTDVTFTVPAGETMPVDFNITIPANYSPGSYYLGFVYDTPFAYGINNYDNYYVDVIKGSGVDPTPSTGDPMNVTVSTADDQTVYIGENNTIRATLRNSDTNKVTLPLYAALCAEDDENIYILGNASGSPAEYTVNGGSTASVNISLPVGADVEEGEYFLAFVYEPDGEDPNLMNDMDCYVTAVRRTVQGTIAVDNAKLWFTAKDNNPIQRDLSVTGTSLTGNITLSLQGDNAAYYSLSTSTLPAAGGKVTVTFDAPLTDGDYTCTLRLSANGASDVEVSLKGTRQGGGNPPAPAKPDALGKLNAVWSYSQTEGNLADASWFATTSPFTRSMAVIGNNLYILNAHPFKTNPAIHVIDADKGTFKGTLMADGAGIETGTNYNSASVLGAIDGDLILVNATRDQATHKLRIYKFTGGQGTPVKLLDMPVGSPLLTNMGEHAGIANGRIAFCDGSKVIYFEMDNGVLNSTPKTITLTKSIGSNGSRYQARFEEDGTFWLSHKDAAPVHYNASGAIIEQLGSSVLSSIRGTDACTFTYGNHKYMTAVATDNSVSSGWGNGHLELLRITDGIANATNEGSYPAAGLGTANWGGSAAMSQCAVQISGDNQGTAKFWVLVPQQGIAHFRYDASTTSVNDIAADSTDTEAEIEYYNLQGVRMRPETLAPGIYIRRQGNTVTKVMIK